MSNKELIAEFLEEIKSKKVAESSSTAYENDLKTLDGFMGDNSILFIDKKILFEYIEYLKLNFEDNVVQKKIASLKVFCKSIYGKGLIKILFTDELKSFKQESSIQEVLTADELELLLRACEPSEKGNRDYLVMKLLIGTGMQLNTVLDLNKDAVNENSIAFEKSNKKYLIKIDDEIKELIVSYKTNSICGIHKLFEGFTRQNFFARIKKYQREAGITKKINPAKLKNTAMFEFIEKGTPMRELKEKLNYTNVGTTGIYKLINKSEMKKIYEKIGIGDWDVSQSN